VDIVKSVNNVPIRLTDERWLHIIDEHAELVKFKNEILETISDPDIIYQGKYDELMAVKSIQTNKYIIVVYKETKNDDGFIITSFLTSKQKYLQNREILWEKNK